MSSPRDPSAEGSDSRLVADVVESAAPLRGDVQPAAVSVFYLLLWTLAAGVLCCATIIITPIWIATLMEVTLTIAVPMVLVVALIYGRGYLRTYCIGGLFPSALTLVWFACVAGNWHGFGRLVTPSEDGRFGLAIASPVGLAAIVLSGLLAMGVRWMVEGPQRAQATARRSLTDLHR